MTTNDLDVVTLGPFGILGASSQNSGERVIVVPINIRTCGPEEQPTHRCTQKAYLPIDTGRNYS